MFAPTNAAFTALEANLGYTPAQLLADPILTPILKYHVVPDVAAQVRKLPVVQNNMLPLPLQLLSADIPFDLTLILLRLLVFPMYLEHSGASDWMTEWHADACRPHLWQTTRP